MKTATEVGGDYYDFKLHEDGTLTMVIGDATGHGMHAGTMVSATKSLFHALADEPMPVQFLKKCTEAIKAMGLKKMYMALTIAKFQDHRMQIAAAGMPFPLVYRSYTSRVEEVVLKGMPLGGFTNFPYKEKKIRLNPGDTVLFISDGLEEMFNPQDEVLGGEQVKILFEECASRSPEEIIAHLQKAGEAWADGRDQVDDVTFVVIKIK
jgi:serine phosphatase RsbU (regulator of sigma subunit)